MSGMPAATGVPGPASPGREVLVIMNIPTPYRVPLFNELDRQLKAAGYRLRVVFGAMGYPGREWSIPAHEMRFDFQVLPSRSFSFGQGETVTFTYPGLYRLLRGDPVPLTVVIGFSPATIKLWFRSWWRPTPYIIWSGAPMPNAGRPVSFLRRWQRRLLVKRAAAFVAYGTAARECLIWLGAPAPAVHIAINSVDTEFFRRRTAELAAGTPALPGPPRFVCLSYLRPGKRIGVVLEAIARLAARRRDFVLDIVGDGDQRAELEARARDLGIADLVVFHGFRQRDEIPSFLVHRRALLFQTNFDIWGLVLVEGMAAGLPCLASINAGATWDLVEDGVTGYRVDFDDTDRVVAILERLLDDPAHARAMGEAASERIRAQVSLEKSAAGIVAAVRTADRA